MVYEVFDKERQALVALKALPQLDPGPLYQFKHEFRSLCRVSHPNLITLHELFSEGDRWYFTMELVDGVDFLGYVRDMPEKSEAPTQTLADVTSEECSVGRCDYPRLRAALRQLTEGVAALHAEGKLHRDLKPSNVMVTLAGHVVVLDFGLVAEFRTGGAPETLTFGKVQGTLAYMSPEQCVGEPLTPASDWYSVGVMVYLALTSRLPFNGTYLQVLTDKQAGTFPPPRSFEPTVPEDLEQLCLHLLRRAPAERATAADILNLLGSVGPIELAAAPASAESGDARLLVGREPELAALQRALELCRKGVTTIVKLHGRSGIGKTALANCFLDRAADAGAVVLTGRCYEQESVPFKILDGLVDSLTRYLTLKARAAVAEIVPRDIGALLHVFPVLGRVDAIAQARGRWQEGIDQRELRRRAFAALRELLARIGDRNDLVLFVDDLQWGDAESAQLLKAVLQPPDSPHLLLICAYRSEYAARSECLRLLFPESGESDGPELREIPLQPLDAEEAGRLAARLLRTHTGAAEAANIARESQGSPYFLHELARRASAAVTHDEPSSELTLDSVIWLRVRGLPEEARRLLEVVCVPGRPLRQGHAYQAGGFETRNWKALVYLRNNNLVRSTGPSERDEVEPYHDRIRESVVSHLQPERLVAYHHSLALTLEAAGDSDSEGIASHFESAGERERAGVYYAQAGEKAADALAFDHAARLLRRAMELRPVAGAERTRLQSALAQALANAGRAAEAARLYQEAAQHATPDQRRDLDYKAAYYFGMSGHIDDGKATFARMLRQVGLKLPETTGEAIRAVLWSRLELRLRGLNFQKRESSEAPAGSLERADLAWAAATGLTMVDLFGAAAFSCRNLLLALKTGDPFRIARGLLLEAISRGVGPSGRRDMEGFIERASRLVGPSGNAYLCGLEHLARACYAFSSCRWSETLKHACEAETIFQQQCRLAWWELATSRNTILFCLVIKAENAELQERCTAWMRDARERGDRFCATTMGVYAQPNLELYRDRPAEARRILDESLAEWPEQAFQVQSLLGLLTRGYIHLYLGEGRQAWDLVQSRWPVLKRYHVLRHETNRITLSELRARAAICAVLAGAAREPLLTIADHDTAQLEKEVVPTGGAYAAGLRASLAELRGDRAGAIAHLERAEQLNQAIEMPQRAAAARRTRGILIGGDAGAALVKESDALLLRLGIANPRNYTAFDLPMAAHGLAPGGSNP